MGAGHSSPGLAPLSMTYNTPEPLLTLLVSLSISFLAYKLTSDLIPRLSRDFVRIGLKGIDLLKGHKRVNGRLQGPELPEATGMIGAGVYILLLTFFAPLPYYTHFLPPGAASLLPATVLGGRGLAAAEPAGTATATSPNLDPGIVFPHHSLSTYLASLLSLLIACFLGFLDDLFDIRWRYKLPIPIVASIPLLVVYFAGHGITDVVLPKVLGLRNLFNVEHVSGVLHLGPIYYVYMAMLSTFCTNSINILAGSNGVEVGQALVIAISIALNDLLYLQFNVTPWLSLLQLSTVTTKYTGDLSQPTLVGFNFARGSMELQDRHLFSLYFMLPLIGVCLGLLKHNWFPAKAFIGDTFCYFSGMTFACVGILSHFSKTLLLFFIPQILNFIFSVPQLFGIMECPRHRLPRYEPSDGLLYPSTVTFTRPPSSLLTIILKVFSFLRVVELTYSSDGRTILKSSNLTILCMVLCLFGPMREASLTKSIMAIQGLGSLLAFGIRYGASSLFYDDSRR